MNPVSLRSPRPLACLALVAGAALCAASAAFAADRTTKARDDATAPAGASAGDPSEKICHRVRPVGSNIPQTICRTRAQMAEEEANAREAMNDRRGR